MRCRVRLREGSRLTRADRLITCNRTGRDVVHSYRNDIARGRTGNRVQCRGGHPAVLCVSCQRTFIVRVAGGTADVTPTWRHQICIYLPLVAQGTVAVSGSIDREGSRIIAGTNRLIAGDCTRCQIVHRHRKDVTRSRAGKRVQRRGGHPAVLRIGRQHTFIIGSVNCTTDVAPAWRKQIRIYLPLVAQDTIAGSSSADREGSRIIAGADQLIAGDRASCQVVYRHRKDVARGCADNRVQGRSRHPAVLCVGRQRTFVVRVAGCTADIAPTWRYQIRIYLPLVAQGTIAGSGRANREGSHITAGADRLIASDRASCQIVHRQGSGATIAG